MTVEKAKKELKKFGYEFVENIEAQMTEEEWVEGNSLFCLIGDPEECTSYIREYDIETGATRHKGLGKGCFWTNWEVA